MATALERLFEQNPMLAKGIIYQQAAERSLYEFVKLMWAYVEPSRPFVESWHAQAICEHLEAVSRGEIRKLLINVSPGASKSLLTNVFFPAWEWLHFPGKRYIAYSYSSMLTERDNIRFRQIIESDLYRSLWSDRFAMSKDRNTIIQVTNDRMGFKQASSVGSGATGFRGDTLIVDDPNNVKESESKAILESTNRWFSEVLPTRVNSPKDSAMIVIQQRTNENDVSGLILSSGDDEWCHLMIPMRFEVDRKCYTSIGWEDPRTEEGELMWPAVYGERELASLQKQMGSYAVSGQHQQSPSPRGGGIIKDKWWGIYPKEGEAMDDYGRPLRSIEYPEMDYIVGSIDAAYTKEKQNDYSAMVVLGVYRDGAQPRIMLMDAWQKRMEFHGVVPVRREGEPEAQYLEKEEWGLVERAAYSCHRFHVDKLLIENKASGITLGQEIRRLYSNEKFGVELVNPKGDKIARAYTVQHLFENGVISAPNRAWAQLCIEQTSIFPNGTHDDLPDALFQCLIWLRKTGWALRKNEYEDEQEAQEYQSPSTPLYDV